MRQALRSNSTRRQVVTGASIAAPVGGWDAQSPLAAMPAKSAVTLNNWIPRPGYVEVRKGYTEHFWGLSDPVETLISYRGASAKLFAASGTGIWDVTTSGSASAAAYGSSLNARWQYTNFANDGGRWVVMVNGQNTPLRYDGSSFADLTITGSSGSLTLDPTTLIDVMPHKRRLFFVEEDSMRVWFLDADAIQGACGLLDLGPVFRKGGYVLCQGIWSLDAGLGPDDYGVWVTNQGEVAVYKGVDPTDANDWSLVGVFDLGLPLSRRSLMKYGADLMLVTTDGIVPLSQALNLDRAQDNLVAITQKIQAAFSQATTLYSGNFGWEGMLYQKGSLAIFNVPVAELSTSIQYVQNVQTGAWCSFSNMDAFCWAISNDLPYFGGATAVYRWDTGSTDDGDDLIADMKTAFNYFGNRGSLKKFELMRPIMTATQNVQPAVDILTDFKESIPSATPTIITSSGALWDEGLWDEALWSDSDEVRYDWTSVTGVGYCGAVRMRVTLSSALDPSPEVDVQFIGADLTFQPGGIL